LQTNGYTSASKLQHEQRRVQQQGRLEFVQMYDYLAASRPYILLSVCLCARFHLDPRESNLTYVKKICRYLKGTTSLGILYKKFQDYKVVGYCDVDYSGDTIERKSTSGNFQFLGDNLISWANKRQRTITLSTVEAEYISAASC
jgi:hypothetical protein